MALADYEGRTPASDPRLTVQHVTHHRRWSPERTARDTCTACGTEFDLVDRHVLVRVDPGDPVVDATGTRSESPPARRRHFCDEACVAAWVGDRGPSSATAAESSQP
ncbi:hypothetical protein [Halobacterium yunchengense]|uniref:hypothetical protein n=1 Tax=Halobacterium yunchengense TaxID=3108497 RepID=UPI00300BD6EA